MKAMIFNGSPRKSGHTAALLGKARGEVMQKIHPAQAGLTIPWPEGTSGPCRPLIRSEI